MKATRLERGQKLRQVCKVNPGIIKLFSDESNFTVDGAYNPQNNRWIAGDRRRKVNEAPHNSLGSLKTSVMRNMAKFTLPRSPRPAPPSSIGWRP